MVKVYCNRSARKRDFSVGDKVMLLRPSKRNRFEVQWEGPAIVTHKLSSTNYAVELGGRRKSVRVYHCNLMKQHQEREAVLNLALNASNKEIPDIPSISDSQDLTVAAIMSGAHLGECLKPS